MDDIQKELDEAFQELKSLQKETKKLSSTDKNNTLKSPKVTKEKMTSSWAMSKTARSGGVLMKPQSRTSSPDPIAPSTDDKTAAKSFTISKSIKRSIFESTPSSISKEDYYDSNIDVLSSKKRSRSAIIPKLSEKSTVVVENHPTNSQQSVSSQSEECIDRKDPVKTFSFSKAKRDKSISKEDYSTQSDLNIEPAVNLIRERPPTAVFSKEKRGIGTDSREIPPPPNPQIETRDLNIEILSNRTSSNVGGKIAPPQRSHSRKRSSIDQSDYGNPGPGAYTDSISKVYSISASSTRKGIQFASTPTSEGVKAHRKKKLIGQGPGPGAYEISTADTHVKQRVPGFSNLFRPESSDIKNTPQLQKKKYWEEKARDAREEPEEIKESNLNIIHKRTPTVTIRPDESKGIDYKNREIIRKIRAEKMREASIGYYDKKYDVIELQPPAPVRMEQQVKSKENTKAMLESAGITPASQLRALEAAKRDYYLGPQLQIPWEEDRLKINTSDEDSPTEEVMKLLRKRKNNEGLVVVTDTTDAYLRSSYTGTLGSRATTIQMREPTQRDVRKGFDVEINPEIQNRDYLPTQLHHDWGENKNVKLIQMDLIPGREKYKISQKGVVETILFHEPAKNPLKNSEFDEDDDNNHNTHHEKKFGDDIRGGVIDFNRHVAWKELVGPNGERPENERKFQKFLHEMGEGGEEEEEVIINPIQAKEKILKQQQNIPKLYVKDREEPPKPPNPGQTHLGGEWFQGMANEKKSTVVNYELMNKYESEKRDYDKELDLVPEELILEVTDWKPHQIKSETVGPAWMDPKKDPRFGKEKKSDYVGEDLPVDLNYDYLKPREGLHVLNMKNNPDRWVNSTVEEEFLQNEIQENSRNILEKRKNLLDAREEDNQIRDGEEMQSTKKRVINVVNMKQQMKRLPNMHESDAPDVVYEINDTQNKGRQDLGVRKWELMPGRENKIITKEKNQFNNSPKGSDDEEVVISPKVTSLSSTKRIISAPAWSQQKGKNHPDPIEPIGNRLHYDIETEFGDEIKGGARYAQDEGRKNDLQLHELEGDEYMREELELEPNYQLLKHVKGEAASLGGVPWAKQNDLKERITEKRNEVIEDLEESPQGQVLDLEIPPPINWNNQRKGGFSKVGIDEGRLRASDSLPNELRTQQEELILNPIDHKKQQSNSQVKWEKQANNFNKSEIKRVLDPFQAEGEADEEGVLILSPQPPKTQSNSIPKWNKQSTTPINQHFNNSLEEELQLSPKNPSNPTSRVGPSWKKQEMDQRFQEDPSWSPKEELILDPKKEEKKLPTSGKFRQSMPRNGNEDTEERREREELILSPQDPSINRIKTGPAWNKQQDDGRSEGLHPSNGKNTSVEELILSPKNTTTSTSINRSGGVSWKKQNDLSSDPETQRSDQREELILSPKKLKDTNKMISWDKEPVDHSISQGHSKEELILSPFSSNQKTKQGISFSKQNEISSQPHNNDMKRRDFNEDEKEELILSPDRTQNKKKIEEKKRTKSPSNVKTTSTKTKNTSRVEPTQQPKEMSSSKKVTFDSNLSSGKTNTNAAVRTESGKNTEPKKKSQSQSQSQAQAQKVPKSTKGKVEERNTATPPKVDNFTPSGTAVPYSFKPTSEDEIRELDRKLQELGI